MCIDIAEIWFRSAEGKFHEFLTELSARDMSIFSLLDDNFSNYQWIYTKLGMCIDFVEIWFGIRIANEQISSIFARDLPTTHLCVFISEQ